MSDGTRPAKFLEIFDPLVSVLSCLLTVAFDCFILCYALYHGFLCLGTSRVRSEIFERLNETGQCLAWIEGRFG